MDDTRDQKPELAKKPSPNREKHPRGERNLSVIQGSSPRSPGGPPSPPPPRRRPRVPKDFITKLDDEAKRMQKALMREKDRIEPSRANAMVMVIRLRAELYSQYRATERVRELERQLEELRPLVHQTLERARG